jgi:hypothetical protein
MGSIELAFSQPQAPWKDDSHKLCRWSAGIAVDHGFGRKSSIIYSNAKDKESRAHRLLILPLLLYRSARIPWELRILGLFGVFGSGAKF